MRTCHQQYAELLCNHITRWLKGKSRRFSQDSELRKVGLVIISDLWRDMNPVIKWLMKLMTKPKEIKSGLISSISAAYTVDEIRELLKGTKLQGYDVHKSVMGLTITGEKSS
jgi:hypothetical protein